MNKNKLNKFNKLIDRICEDALDEMASEIFFEMENQYEKSVDEFYAHYDPYRYKRNYNIYLASDGYKSSQGNIKSHKNGTNDSRIITVNISSKNIPGKPYTSLWGSKKLGLSPGDPIDTEFVFHNVFYLGRHGYPLVKKDENGRGILQDGQFLTLNHMRNIPNFTPSPKERVDKWFKNFKKDYTLLNKIKTTALKKAIKRHLSKGR